MSTEYRIARLPNGLIRVDHRPSGLVGMFNPDGSRRSGQLRVPASVVQAVRDAK